MYIMKSQNQILHYLHVYNNSEKSYEAMIIIRYFIKSYILD